MKTKTKTKTNLLNDNLKQIKENVKNNVKDIDLLPHQIATVTRVVAKCQKQKGMILFHEMGTGKTLTALGILLNYRFDQTAIFCDPVLLYTWQKEMKKIDFENLKHNVEYFPQNQFNNEKDNETNLKTNNDRKNNQNSQNSQNYNSIKNKNKNKNNEDTNEKNDKRKRNRNEIVQTDLKTYDKLETYDFKDKVIVIDEAHNIAHMLKTIDVKKAYALMENFKKCKKIILLSGTPIFKTYTDLSVLINIAAGKHIATYNHIDFMNKYMKLDQKTSRLHGHIYPKIVRAIRKTLGMASRFLLPNTNVITSMVVSFVMGKQLSMFQQIKQSAWSWLGQYNPLSTYLSMKPKGEKLEESALEFNESHKDNINNSKNVLKRESKRNQNVMKMNQNQNQNQNQIQNKNENTFFQYLKQNGFGQNMSSLSQYGRYLVSAYLFVYVLSRASYNIIKKMDTYGIYELAEYGTDNTHIIKDLVPYLDFYKPDAAFPKKIDISKKVEYNYYQIEEWLRLAYEVDVEETRKLNENEKNNTYNLQFNPLEFDQYLNYGRVIGNLTYHNTPPPKFVALLKFINKNKGQHLIYSNFLHKGSTLLKTFFEAHRVQHAFLHPKMTHQEIDKMLEEYKNGKNRILILHHEFTEGISIPGTTYFHILEPVLEFSKYNQIIGRSLRSDSHVHLPPKERYVKVINWKCTCEEFNSNQKKMMLKYKIWAQFFRQVEIQKMEDNRWLSDYRTPDQASYQYLDTLLIFKEVLQKETEKHGNNVCATGETQNKCTISTFKKKGSC